MCLRIYRNIDHIFQTPSFGTLTPARVLEPPSLKKTGIAECSPTCKRAHESYLEVQAIASRKHETVILRHQLQPAVALHHAGQVGESSGPDVEVFVQLRFHGFDRGTRAAGNENPRKRAALSHRGNLAGKNKWL